jgi:hypothetical protein
MNLVLFHNALSTHSYFAQFVKAACLQTFAARSSGDREPVFYAMDRDNHEYVGRARNALRSAVRQLTQLEMEHHFRAIVVAIPDRYQLVESIRSAQATYYGMSLQSVDPWQPNSMLALELAEAHIPLIDPSQCMLEQPDVEALYYKHDNHFTKLGHEAFVKCTFESLVGWLDGQLAE